MCKTKGCLWVTSLYLLSARKDSCVPRLDLCLLRVFLLSPERHLSCLLRHDLSGLGQATDSFEKV